MLVRECAQPTAQPLAQLGGALDEALIIEHVEARQSGGGAERVAGEALAMAEDVIVEGARDVFRENYRGGGAIDAERLAHDDDVGRDAVVLEGEHAARAAHAGHRLVGDQQQVPLVAQRAQAADVALGRRDDAV